MTEIHKIMQGVERWFSPSITILFQSIKQIGSGFGMGKRGHFFKQHIVSLWNSLPQDVMMTRWLSKKIGHIHGG